MPRNDSLLYTGLNSRAFVEQRKARRNATKQKSEARSQLIPKATIVLDMIKAERDQLRHDVGELITLKTSEREIKNLKISYGFADTRLASLETKIKNTLRLVIKEPDLEEEPENE